MTSYVLNDQGTVVPGGYALTSFAETPIAGEVGQLIVFEGRPYTEVLFYGVRKVLMAAPPPEVTIGYPVVGGRDLKLWSPVTFVPVSDYYDGGTTALYFPERSPLGTTQVYKLYRVVE